MRGKELMNEQREQIISAYLADVKVLNLALKFNIPQATVYDTIKRYQETNSPHPEKRSGQPKTLSNHEKHTLKRVILKNRFSPLGEITNELNGKLNTTYHANTIRKYLDEIGFGSYTPRKKSLLTPNQELHRLNWCWEKHNWKVQWKDIIWSDESRFVLFESDDWVRIWRKPGEAYHQEYIKPTVKFDGESVMFWGCFSWDGVGPLIPVEKIINSDIYVNILANYFVPWARQYLYVTFQQDGAPCHTSTYTTWWLSTHDIRLLDWVGQSPDLNLIEHLWDILDRRIRKRRPLPTSKQELIHMLQEEWVSIDLETLRGLILSLPRRVDKVIEANGKSTSY